MMAHILAMRIPDKWEKIKVPFQYEANRIIRRELEETVRMSYEDWVVPE